MRVTTPQIAFHQNDDGKNDPVLSIDVHPSGTVIATGGSDNEVKLWSVEVDRDEGSPFTFKAAIVPHARGVNAVRFSPDGASLASCSDEGRICLMTIARTGQATWTSETGGWDSVADEKDLSRKYLRGHTSDVVDLAWSRDSRLLVSGSVDGTVILWDVREGKLLQSFTDHGHYIQGVAWDPYGHQFCSESADRSVRVFQAKPGKRSLAAQQASAITTEAAQREEAPLHKFRHLAELSKRLYNVLVPGEDGAADEPKRKSRGVFLDDSIATFFRRPAWSPDGCLLVTPTGQFRASKETGPGPTTFVYLRGQYQSPALHLPGLAKASIAVRFNPCLFKLKDGSGSPWLTKSYRMVFAVATLDSIFVYDTQHVHPIAAAEHLHLAQLTDLAWTPDGRALLVSSNDGYCSILAMDCGELGESLPKDSTPRVALPPPRAEHPPYALLALPSGPVASTGDAATSKPAPSSPALVPQVNTLKPKRKKIQPTLVQPLPTKAQVTMSPATPERLSAPATAAATSTSSTSATDMVPESPQPKKRRAALVFVSPLGSQA